MNDNFISNEVSTPKVDQATFKFDTLYPVSCEGAVNYIFTGIKGVPLKAEGYVVFGYEDDVVRSFKIPQVLHTHGFDTTGETYNIICTQSADSTIVIMITTNDDRLVDQEHYGAVTLDYIPLN